ncbi:MAG: type II toxin-antitoxin system prevent-host-death family antitoxin [Thalassotalea sp.]|nr:type II toxin-antitoxin system prevent-host-death family antitoxin [Thalassotalea sp.]
MQANMHEAKSKLSQLVEAAMHGEEVIIAKSGKALVKLIPCKPTKKRVFGLLKGKVILSDDSDSIETNDEILEMFGV